MIAHQVEAPRRHQGGQFLDQFLRREESEKEMLALRNEKLQTHLEALTTAVRRLEAMAAVETEVKLAVR